MERWIASVDRSNPGKLKTWKSIYLENLNSKDKPIDLFKEVKVLNSDAYKVDLQKVDYIPAGRPKTVSSSTFTNIKNEIKETIDEVTKTEKWSSLTASAKKAMPSAEKAVKWGLIGGLAYLGYKGIQSLSGIGKDRSDYISASSLGKSEEDLLKAIKSSRNVSSFNQIVDSQEAQEKSDLSIGTRIHKVVEEEFQESSEGYASEYEVRDDELGIKGNIDVVLSKNGQKIPVELKTTSSDILEGLEEPLKEHASQANFYAHALNAPGSYVTYIDKGNVENRKTFYVPYSPGTLIRDVADFRSVLLQNRDIPGALLGWAKQSEDYWESETVPTPQYGKYMGGPKTRDQRSKNSHLFPIGQNNNTNYEENGSRYHRRN